MIDAGIKEKDLIIVEKNKEPQNGDIILAEVDGNWTMKYFCRKGKVVTLEAANPKYPRSYHKLICVLPVLLQRLSENIINRGC